MSIVVGICCNSTEFGNLIWDGDGVLDGNEHEYYIDAIDSHISLIYYYRYRTLPPRSATVNVDLADKIEDFVTISLVKGHNGSLAVDMKPSSKIR